MAEFVSTAVLKYSQKVSKAKPYGRRGRSGQYCEGIKEKIATKKGRENQKH